MHYPDGLSLPVPFRPPPRRFRFYDDLEELYRHFEEVKNSTVHVPRARKVKEGENFPPFDME
ncbi:MAG: hypothetical protein SFY92_01700 [Verrucomicrobiae bacterium]|nr:hypothetical protein [Verrucomicrobiae bacterium]